MFLFGNKTDTFVNDNPYNVPTDNWTEQDLQETIYFNRHEDDVHDALDRLYTFAKIAHSPVLIREIIEKNYWMIIRLYTPNRLTIEMAGKGYLINHMMKDFVTPFRKEFGYKLMELDEEAERSLNPIFYDKKFVDLENKD